MSGFVLGPSWIAPCGGEDELFNAGRICRVQIIASFKKGGTYETTK